jgi:endogenous inhibitor of DNA gyrase (YacG/DUF329 family)
MPKKQPHEIECRICCKIFEASRSHARYCSPRCRQVVSRLMRQWRSEQLQGEQIADAIARQESEQYAARQRGGLDSETRAAMDRKLRGDDWP